MRNRMGVSRCCCNNVECLKYSMVPSEGKPWPAWSLLNGVPPTQAGGTLSFTTPGKIRVPYGTNILCGDNPSNDDKPPLTATIHLKSKDARLVITTIDNAYRKRTVEFRVTTPDEEGAPVGLTQRYPLVHVIWRDYQGLTTSPVTGKMELVLDRFLDTADVYTLLWRETEVFSGAPCDPGETAVIPADRYLWDDYGGVYPITVDRIFTPQWYVNEVGDFDFGTSDLSGPPTGHLEIQLIAGSVDVSDLRLFYQESVPDHECEGCLSPGIANASYLMLDNSAYPGDEVASSYGLTGTVPAYVELQIPPLSPNPLPIYQDPECDCSLGEGQWVHMPLRGSLTDEECTGLTGFTHISPTQPFACGVPDGYQFSAFYDTFFGFGSIGYTNNPTTGAITIDPQIDFVPRPYNDGYSRRIWHGQAILPLIPYDTGDADPLGTAYKQYIGFNVWVALDHFDQNTIWEGHLVSHFQNPCVVEANSPVFLEPGPPTNIGGGAPFP